MKLLGSIIYAVPGTRLRTTRGVLFGGSTYPSKGQKTTTIRDVAVYFPVNTAKPFILNTCDDDDPVDLLLPGGCSYLVGDSQAEAPKTYTNLSIIGGGIYDGNAGVWRRSVFGVDWIGTNVEEILEDDLGVDIFTDDGVGASICYRYVDGVLTSEPLWPWPMQDRIAAATERSLWDTADVNAEIEAVFGPIPGECKKY